ncbi:hypothetical protein KOR34_51110 [Posidoniimonas corsicana]|uniref:Four-carbon acid sugar kinase family protein n=1 Tax=Posidoniimonas corsicana TaxID=1938618 RepID=A0A5C5UW00_9BACT|nr:four-carbon acid sugar kinase family protein [Posidoniimonas corsicana]TWT29793.1 hypothetical protein KOR34_51110 [Posidoniimonas corsicana]
MTDSPSTTPLRLAYYADDFTGSTDALQVLARAGLQTRLFLNAPTPNQLAAHGPLDAIGVAGRSRSLPTEQLAGELHPAFEALRNLRPRHVHYKVCSTFDSSPAVGSIGRVLEIGSDVFAGPYAPIVVGAPALGRWCVFGNLFARYGIGSEGGVYRLDRHPAMWNHPTTPATESDLRRQLAQQTELPVGLVDVTHLDAGPEASDAALQSQLAAGARAVLFDAMTDEHLNRVGQLLEASAAESAPLFSIGSSGVESALAAQWQAAAPAAASALPPTDQPLLVIAGSCSPVTAEQIDHALQNGFAEAPLDAAALLDERRQRQAIADCLEAARVALTAGRPVVVHTSRGADDPRRAAVAQAMEQRSLPPDSLAQQIGGALGAIALECRRAGLAGRVCVAGGDTSSYAGRALGVASLAMLHDFWPGAPVCAAASSDPAVDGLPIVFKGGQVGGPDFFTQLAQ